MTLSEPVLVTKGGLNALQKEHTNLQLEEGVVLDIYSLIFFSNNSSPVVSDRGTWHYIWFPFFKDGFRQGSLLSPIKFAIIMSSCLTFDFSVDFSLSRSCSSNQKS